MIRTRWAGRRKLIDRQARIIRHAFAGGCTKAALAREFHISAPMVTLIVEGFVYRDAGGPILSRRSWS